MLDFDSQLEGWQSGLMRRTRNAVGGNPSEVQILYPPQNNMEQPKPLIKPNQENLPTIERIASSKYQRLRELKSHAFRYINFRAELEKQLSREKNLTSLEKDRDSIEVHVRNSRFLMEKSIDTIKANTGHITKGIEDRNYVENDLIRAMVSDTNQNNNWDYKIKTESFHLPGRHKKMRIRELVETVKNEIEIAEKIWEESGHNVYKFRSESRKRLPSMNYFVNINALNLVPIKAACKEVEGVLNSNLVSTDLIHQQKIIRAISLLSSENLLDLPYDSIIFIDPDGIRQFENRSWGEISNDFDGKKHVLGIAPIGVYELERKSVDIEKIRKNMQENELVDHIKWLSLKDRELSIPVISNNDLFWPKL